MIENAIVYARQAVEQISGGNQMIAGAISLWALGVGSYIFKSIPNKIRLLAVKHCTTSFTLDNSDRTIYNEFCKYYCNKPYFNNIRKIKIFGSIKFLDYGSHIFWDGFIPLKINIQKEDSQGVHHIKESITVTKFGRSHKYFDSIMYSILKIDTSDKLDVYVHKDGYLDNTYKIEKRNWETIILDIDLKNKIEKSIDKFLKSEKWYVDRGIPYKMCIMLYGPPGTGKTSLVKSLSSKFNKKLNVQNYKTLVGLSESISSSSGDFFLIEDIDSYDNVGDRESDENKKLITSDDYTLSTVLNSLDGIGSGGGTVIFITTNHINKLDSAIFRSGRCDLTIEICYVTNSMFSQFMKIFFDITGTWQIKDKKFTVADLQKDFLDGLSSEEIIERYCIDY